MPSTHSFEGKRVAISGRFLNTSKTFTAELEALGAQVTRSVSSRTDYLVLGTGTGGAAYEKATHLGVVVLNEAQARAVMAGEAIEVNRPGEAGERSIDELLGEARSLTAQPPSPQVWRELLLLFDECDIAQHAELTHYIGAHTSQWSTAQMQGQYGREMTEEDLDPSRNQAEQFQDKWQVEQRSELLLGELRVAPKRWSGELMREVDSPKFELIRALSLMANSKALMKAFTHPHLKHISRLCIDAEPTPTLKLWKMWCQPERLAHLTHLRLESMSPKAAEHMCTHTKPMALEVLDLSNFYIKDCKQQDNVHDALARTPFFSTIHTLILCGWHSSMPHLAHQFAQHNSLPELKTLRMRCQDSFRREHLRLLIDNGLFDGVEHLDLGDITIDQRRMDVKWRQVCRHALPESVKTLDLSHLTFYQPQPLLQNEDSLIALALNALFEGELLSHITHVRLGKAFHDPRFTDAFADACPDITLTV